MEHFKEATEVEKRNQLARAKQYIQDNPDDPDNDELYELIDKLEKELNLTSKLDLNAMLEKARDIVTSILPEMDMNKIDSYPTITFGKVGSRSLGICNYRTDPPSITISESLKNADEGIVMNTVIHEFIHSLRICWRSGHTGNFKALAQRVSNQTPYNIDTYATDSEVKAHTDNLANKSYYQVTCKKCGTETIYYKKARIVDSPEDYSCRKCGATGQFKIAFVPKEGGAKIIKEDGAYKPGEREAMDGLYHFEHIVLRNALEKAFPGSCPTFWVEGSPMSWKSRIPVITDESNKDKIIPLLANLFGVSKDKVEYNGIDQAKVKKTDLNRSYSDNYIPYKTMNRLIFDVDWKNTTNEDLSRYQNYIRQSMKGQGIIWENSLLEGINKPTQNRIGNFALDVLVDRRYGNSKFTDIADVEVGPDYLDIAFDFHSYAETVHSGLSGRESVIVHPTPTEIEVTEKRIDKFMTEDFPALFFRYYNVTPFFRIIKDEHRWIDDNSLACFYTIEQLNERK